MRGSSTPHSPDVGRTLDPPRDELPVAPGLRGHPAHDLSDVPMRLRVPTAAAIGAGVGIATVSAMVLPVTLGLIPGDALPWMALGTSWAAFTYWLLRPLGKRRPFLTGQIHAALLVVPGMSGLIRWDFAAVEMSEFWGTAAICSGVIGCVLGRVFHDASAQTLIEVEAGRGED